jgi:hypothetical protein
MHGEPGIHGFKSKVVLFPTNQQALSFDVVERLAAWPLSSP